jgi:phage terminase large subunit-like protein
MRKYKEFSNLSPYFELEEDTKHSLIIKSTGSHIKAMEMTEKVGRSFRYKYALFTEIAHWQNPRDSYKALTGAGVADAEEVIESTRNIDEPEGELFEELLENPDYYKLVLDYKVNLTHDAEWEKDKRGKLTPREFAQEYECSGERSASGNLVIPLDAYYRAINRDISEGLPVELGGDVARYGDDESVLTIRKGNKAEPQIIYKHIDLMQLADEWYSVYMNKKAEAIKVDAIGIGAGVVDALKRKGINVIEVNESQSPADEKYQNARAEMYFNIREKAMNDEISIPDDPELKTEVSYTHYKTNSQMRIQIEAKDDIKKKIGRSPDRADSLALAFYKGRTGTPSIFFA